MQTIMYEKLKALAQDAIQARDVYKMHEIIGQVAMAYELRQLTWSQQDELTDMLVYAAGKWGEGK